MDAMMPPTCRLGVAAMGCLFEVLLWGDDPEWCEGVAREALDEIVGLDRQMSHYRDDSDIARLNAYAARGPVRVEPQLFGLLQRCAEWWTATEGAFDVAIGRLLECWGFHRGTGRVPSEEEIGEALASSGMRHIALDPLRSEVHFRAPGLALNLGAVGKGYALDRAASVLRFYGAQSALLHGGHSTILAIGGPPEGGPWTFPIRDPRQPANTIETIGIRDAALSTSGNYTQYVEANGMRYGHILDPRTGHPVQGTLQVSLRAADAASADALSTALFVLGCNRASWFAERFPQVSFVLLSEGSEGSLEVTRAGLP